MPELRMVKRTKGVGLATEDGHVIWSMSWTQAARLLFQMKDLIRGDRIGAGCLDDVHRDRVNGPDIRAQRVGRWS